MDWLSLHFVNQMAAVPGATADFQLDGLLAFLAFLMASTTAFATLTLHERITVASRLLSRRLWTAVTAICLGGGLWAADHVALLAVQTSVETAFDVGGTALALLIYLAVAALFLHLLGRPGRQALDQWEAIVVAGLGVPAAHYVAVMALRGSAMIFYRPVPFGLAFVAGLLAATVAVRLRQYFRHQRRSTYALLKYTLSLLTGLAIIGMLFTAIGAMQLLMPSGLELSVPHPGLALRSGIVTALVALVLESAAIGAAYADAKLQSKEQDLIRVNNLLSQLDRARDSLQQLANYDHLTNLLNRRSFTEQFSARLRLPEHHGRPLALLYMDLDYFKHINDALGHEAGDEILKIVARRIRTVLRSQQDRRGDDLIARFGGDEFCMLLPLNTATEAMAVSQRLLQKIREPLSMGDRAIVMTTSLGICVYPDDGNTVDELMKHAELALYQAKDDGRNSMHLFSSALRARAGTELQITEGLPRAVGNSELSLYYQPVCDLRTGRIVQVEALLRWDHPQLGPLLPERFVGVAERSGLIGQLDSWAFRKACADLSELHRRGWPTLRVSVNCSALNLSGDSLADTCRETLEATGLAGSFVDVEVTENAVMANIERAVAQLSRMRALGMGIAVDDFGTGYSSLSCLKSLPVNLLKVDRSFINGIPGNNSDAEITAAVIAMAHKLNLLVVAEGAESEVQIQFLRDNGCDRVQGFCISEPLPLEELVVFLQQQGGTEIPAPAPTPVPT